MQPHRSPRSHAHAAPPARVQALWIFSLAVSTLYTYSWDVTMDWGLGRPQYNGLRKRLMYRRVWVYYGGSTPRFHASPPRTTPTLTLFCALFAPLPATAAICADLVLRFLWTLTLLPSRAGVLLLADYLDPFLAAAEICRRTMWGLFRLENEHLSNTEGCEPAPCTHTALPYCEEAVPGLLPPRRCDATTRA